MLEDPHISMVDVSKETLHERGFSPHEMNAMRLLDT